MGSAPRGRAGAASLTRGGLADQEPGAGGARERAAQTSGGTKPQRVGQQMPRPQEGNAGGSLLGASGPGWRRRGRGQREGQAPGAEPQAPPGQRSRSFLRRLRRSSFLKNLNRRVPNKARQCQLPNERPLSPWVPGRAGLGPPNPRAGAPAPPMWPHLETTGGGSIERGRQSGPQSKPTGVLAGRGNQDSDTGRDADRAGGRRSPARGGPRESGPRSGIWASGRPEPRDERLCPSRPLRGPLRGRANRRRYKVKASPPRWPVGLLRKHGGHSRDLQTDAVT